MTEEPGFWRYLMEVVTVTTAAVFAGGVTGMLWSTRPPTRPGGPEEEGREKLIDLIPRRWKMVLAGIPVVGLTLIGVGAWGMANIDQPEVTTKEATAVAHTRAMLNGSLPSLGGSSSLEVYFEWGKSDSYGSSTDKVTLESAGPFSAEIDTLDPDEEYHFRAIASSGTCDDCGS